MLGEMGKGWQVCTAVPRPPSIKWHVLVCVGRLADVGRVAGVAGGACKDAHGWGEEGRCS